MSSQVTSQVWYANDTDYDEDTISINGILERSAVKSFSSRQPAGDKEKTAYVWTSNFIENDSKNIYRASFTSGANASRNTKAENDDYMLRANEVSTFLHDSLKDSASQWGDQCRTQQSAKPLRDAEKSTFDSLVNTMPDRYGDIGLGSVDRETMKQVLLYDENQGDLSSGGNVVGANMEEGDDMKMVAGMPFVRTGASIGYGFLSQQPSFYHGDDRDD
ncbi:hypothetical protein L198_06253 [Cryptococcus wingfieldii CBS 7118]|uniref:Uncharacterized protein n=1 Tax=Cryptococcus wingfieldii CBS 7118 TaxID=1295528 RepID=A0A1E3IP75_9TREE|nr:hypothetical protein L198_06253 [Cryptococcus wingfieldii CBS 7118]ODN90235.1 hypothetical protein L198_06253 [Cryptococcus wingfieldii CBS 7118]